jgi:hypothetical protein
MLLKSLVGENGFDVQQGMLLACPKIPDQL